MDSKEAEAIAKLVKLETELSQYDGADKVVSSHELLEYLEESKIDSMNYLYSKIPGLDYWIDGFVGGELTVISGPTGNGKTLLAQSLTESFWRQQKNVLWFSYEVPAEQFLKQFGKDLPKFFLPMQLAQNNFTWIEKKIIEARVKYGLHAVVVDHLHFLIDMKRNNLSVEIGQVMRIVKKLALKYNLCFFLITHIGKMAKELTAEPDVDDIRDSSFIGQEADNVLFVWRNKKEDHKAVLKIAKNRRKGSWKKKVNLVKIGSYLREEGNKQDDRYGNTNED